MSSQTNADHIIPVHPITLQNSQLNHLLTTCWQVLLTGEVSFGIISHWFYFILNHRLLLRQCIVAIQIPRNYNFNQYSYLQWLLPKLPDIIRCIYIYARCHFDLRHAASNTYYGDMALTGCRRYFPSLLGNVVNQASQEISLPTNLKE